jgi:uncharacterized protein YndB with AHSA1/START domain
MGKEFELRMETEVEATPEQVWEAIATGPGIDAWFMGHNEVEPGEGGATRMTIAGETSESTITTWDPPNRLAYRSEPGPDGSFHAFEYLVEGRDQATTLVRLVHSGMLGDDWEREYRGLQEGDPVYIHLLAQYLKYFRGRAATPVFAAQPQTAEREQAWSVFRQGLGLRGPVAEGDQVRLTPEGLPVIEGVVDYASPSFLGVRSDDALYRFIYGYDGTVVVGHHIYRDGVDQAGTDQAWQSWLSKLFS